MKKKLFFGVMVAFMLVLASGCGTFASGNSDNSKISIEKDKAKELKLELNIGAGEMNIRTGAKEWVEGTIKNNDDKLKPKVSYKLRGKKGIAVIEQKGNQKLVKIKEIKNIWKLNLNDEIPFDLTVNSGAAKTKLDLKGLKINSLHVNTGVGDMTIDLGGDWKESFNVNLAMGVGKTTIILPKNVGVKIESDKGLGTTNFVGFISKGKGIYVNEAYEDADVIINVKADLGIGKVTYELEK